MDFPYPPPLPREPAPIDPASERLLAAAVGLTALTDFLLWAPGPGGTAVALFVASLAVAFTVSGSGKTRSQFVLLTLTAASAMQAALELKPSTILVSGALLIGIVGEAHFAALGSRTLRWLEALVAVVRPWCGLRHFRALGRRSAWVDEHGRSRSSVVWRVLMALLPALLLAGLFSIFFASGNAVFKQLGANLFTSCLEWLLSLDLSLGRLAFWALVFAFVINLLRPTRGALGTWVEGPRLPRWTRRDEALGRWQSIAILAVLNALFFSVNTIDAIYLWSRSALPAGVNPSAFLHEGVEGLILAVVASAVVLVVLFQQQLAVHCRLLQWLATAWVLQNFVVIAGVFLRLKLYVEVLQLTLLRVEVGLFLFLVVAGFVLLTIYFWRDKGLGWLCQTNAAATFLLFFCVQFIDLNGTVANYNVDRWLHGQRQRPDLGYLVSLGHAAWPALIQLAGHSPTFPGLSDTLQSAGYDARVELSTLTWRGWELRRVHHSRELLAFLKTQPTKP